MNIHAAKTQLSRLIADALAGEDVVISKAGTPLVRLVPVTGSGAPRQLGALSGHVTEADDCWALDDELEQQFYGSEVEPRPVRRIAEPTPATEGATIRRPGSDGTCCWTRMRFCGRCTLRSV